MPINPLQSAFNPINDPQHLKNQSTDFEEISLDAPSEVNHSPVTVSDISDSSDSPSPSYKGGETLTLLQQNVSVFTRKAGSNFDKFKEKPLTTALKIAAIGLLAGGVGFAIGGPPGAVIGLLIAVTLYLTLPPLATVTKDPKEGEFALGSVKKAKDGTAQISINIGKVDKKNEEKIFKGSPEDLRHLKTEYESRAKKLEKNFLSLNDLDSLKESCGYQLIKDLKDTIDPSSSSSESDSMSNSSSVSPFIDSPDEE